MSFPFLSRAVRVCAMAWLALAPETKAQSVPVERSSPAVDVWFYPNATSGTKKTLPVFGALENADSTDNRDGQGYVSFLTTPEIPSGLGASHYLIHSVTLTLTMTVPGVIYDGTYDSVATYIPGSGATDTDNGRPMELFGAGYRNGLTATTVTSNTPFEPSFSTAPRVRSVFATDFTGGSSLNGTNRDVSNSVSDNFDTKPFAIGYVNSNDIVPATEPDAGTIESLSEVTFELNLNNPDVVRYLQLSLDAGFLNFITTSLFTAGFMGAGGGYPTFSSMEGTDPPRLHLDAETIPEPSAVTLLLCGFGFSVAFYRGARLGGGKEQP